MLIYTLVYYLTSEIGKTSLQRTLVSTPYGNFNKYSVLHFDLRDTDDLSTRNKIVGPIVSLVRRFHIIIRTLLHIYRNVLREGAYVTLVFAFARCVVLRSYDSN